MMGNLAKPKVMFVLGAPGAGKGTQCSKIVSEFGYVHLSAGDLLREERLNPTSKNGQLIDTYLKEGKIVPVEITCNLLKTAMLKSEKQKFLIDGFPRNQNNVDGWNKECSQEVELQCVLFFECPLEECVKRCLKRGEAGSGRTDDNEESLKKRVETYLSQTCPIIDYFDKQNSVHKFDASKNPEQVYEDVKRVMEKYN